MRAWILACHRRRRYVRFFPALRLLRAADKMRDDWAEYDASGKQVLWRNLHEAADDLREEMDL